MLKKIVFLSILILSFSIKGFSQYTSIPDPNFEQALIDLGIDTDGLNGQFLTANATGIVDLLIDNHSIVDLTGIEVFLDLERLDARNNNFTSITQLSQNVNLNQITIANSPLVNIDVSQNINLISLIIEFCELNTIDLSNNTNLFSLALGGNNLSTIDLSNNPNLIGLSLSDNNITNIDLSNNSNLSGFSISNNQLITLDVTNLSLLESLNIYENNLIELNLSGNSLLNVLRCRDNLITNLDLTFNPLLEKINCSENPIANITFSTTNSLKELICGDCQLTNLDLSNMPVLNDLVIIKNQFTSIDLSNCPVLETFVCIENNINTHLDLSNNPLLESLYCNDNPVPSINISQNFLLNLLQANNTLITTLNLNNNPLNGGVSVMFNPILTQVDSRNGNNENMIFFSYNSPNLICVLVDDVNSGEGDWGIDSHTNLVNNQEECDALSVNEYYLESLIDIYPNPVNDILIIENINSITINLIKVYDVLGRLVLEEKGFVDQLDVSHLKSGLLFLKIDTNKGVIIKKIVKD